MYTTNKYKAEIRSVTSNAIQYWIRNIKLHVIPREEYHLSASACCPEDHIRICVLKNHTLKMEIAKTWLKRILVLVRSTI